LLTEGVHAAAGIDAPFCVPAHVMPADGHPALIALVDRLNCPPARPFPRGDAFLDALGIVTPVKSLRQTERLWRGRGINVRSSLWWKPRGGASLATACLKLIARAGRPPCWPWSPPVRGCLAEAFPAAQLRQWGLPHQKYNGPDGAANRAAIVRAVSERLDFGPFRDDCLRSADALDAVLAAFGAIAVTTGTLAAPVPDDADPSEGWIAVHR
jgi:hypothetical protein